jgi:hypothetical protein
MAKLLRALHQSQRLRETVKQTCEENPGTSSNWGPRKALINDKISSQIRAVFDQNYGLKMMKW